MLQVITGKAGSGKTEQMLRTIAKNVQAEEKSFLIVPEQYSHQAERELCAICGDTASMYAEVLSFTGLARWVDRQLGSGDPVVLDQGGQLLCMALAVEAICTQLRVYGSARKRVNLQSQLLDAVTELKTACISPEDLLKTAEECDGVLADKLYDLALILGAYDGVVSNGRADPTDKLTRLSERVAEAGLNKVKVYIDGFTDFTRQQVRVIEALLECGTELTICLTCDLNDRNNEVYAITRSTVNTLQRAAEEVGAKVEVAMQQSDAEQTPLEFFSDHMFTYTKQRMEDPDGQIRLYAADSIADECEFAAAQIIRFVRDEGCRWRDIAIAVRGFDAYETMLDSVFRKYNVPLYLTKKTALMEKPLPQLIESAYEIIAGGWDADDVFGYLRTGLVGVSQDECDELENYVLLWDLRGTAWTKDTDWQMHPAGYEQNYTDEDKAILKRVNRLRRAVAAPLVTFAEENKAATTGHELVMALVHLLEALGVDERLSERAALLEAEGYLQQAVESQQIWEITMSALEQFDSILGSTELDADRFAQLFLLMLSRYDVGTIPVSVDRVAAGEMDRVRRRNLKHLIVLGASDENLPRAEEGAGVFSSDDRERLLEVGLDLGSCGDAELWREFSVIYHCLTLPKQTLTMTYPRGSDGRPSIVMNRAVALFDHEIAYIDPAQCKMAAHDSALELAAFSLRDSMSTAAVSAAEYFRETEENELTRLYDAAEQFRGRLSRKGVENLYGQKLRLSASRIERFNGCPFSYYMEYGLKAKPRKVASFAPPEMGTFMHFVLEHVAKDVVEQGGFAEVSDKTLKELTDRYIQQYISQFLNDFHEKSPRFIYLFRRLTKDVRAVVADMAAELKKSQFVPMDFELDFGNPQEIPPMEIGADDVSMTLTGIADRIDGWVHDGKLYLRVVDYKTGKKEFNLSDVWYGMNLQMLLYLFTLEKWGKERYGMDVVPAGVLYVPAFHKNLSQDTNLSDEEIAKEQQKKHKRSGLVLYDNAVLEAMESGDTYEYLPVKITKNGAKSLATAQQLGTLAKYIDETLQELAKELKDGDISATPYYKSQQVNACAYCQYQSVCNFEDGKHGDKLRYLPKLDADTVWDMMEQKVEGGAEDGRI